MPSIKPFLGENFLLENDVAVELFHQYAKDQPIYDFHNHLPPEEIAKDKNFDNISELWLGGDHYKWRAQRAVGIPEEQITGNVDPFLKFQGWAQTVPLTMRNPLYHWTHLELKRYFNIDTLLTPASAKEIYQECNRQLKEGLSCVKMLEMQKVKVIATTDSILDDLSWHKELSTQNNSFKVFPTFRPDPFINLENPVHYNHFIELVKNLGEKVGLTIHHLDDLLSAIAQRHDYFHQIGGRESDHGIEKPIWVPCSKAQANEIFQKALKKENLSLKECAAFRCFVLLEIFRMNSKKAWVQQLHIGPIRNVNRRLHKKLGNDVGGDSVGDDSMVDFLANMLGTLDEEEKLTKTIIYTINSVHNDVIASMCGNFQEGSQPAKIQFGTGWWHQDTKYGMEKQMNTLSSMGLFSQFLGMLTDSRSFLSFPRHEYFRRIFCNLIGNDVVNGELPYDLDALGKMVKDISYENAKKYFPMEV